MEASVLNIKGQDTGRKVVLNDAIYAIDGKYTKKRDSVKKTPISFS